MLDNAFKGHVDPVVLSMLKEVSRDQDSFSGGQGVGRSYQHSMAEPGESADEARTRRDQFISHSLDRARYLAGHNDRDNALKELGAAFHAMMDATSPAHVDRNGDPLVWSGIAGNEIGAAAHWANEAGPPSKDVMDDVSKRMQRAYDSVFPGDRK